MPLQGSLSEPAMTSTRAEVSSEPARSLVNYFIGQGVGLVDEVPSCRQVVVAFTSEFAEALDDMRRPSRAL